jgi:hypothetical protein
MSDTPDCQLNDSLEKTEDEIPAILSVEKNNFVYRQLLLLSLYLPETTGKYIFFLRIIN